MRELEVGASRIGSLLAPESFVFSVPFPPPVSLWFAPLRCFSLWLAHPLGTPSKPRENLRGTVCNRSHPLRQFRFGSHLYVAFRSGSRSPSGRHQSGAKTCEGPFVTGRTPSASFKVIRALRSSDPPAGWQDSWGFWGGPVDRQSREKPKNRPPRANSLRTY